MEQGFWNVKDVGIVGGAAGEVFRKVFLWGTLSETGLGLPASTPSQLMPKFKGAIV